MNIIYEFGLVYYDVPIAIEELKREYIKSR